MEKKKLKQKRFRVVWAEEIIYETIVETDSAEEAEELVMSGEFEGAGREQDVSYGLVGCEEIE